MQTYSLQVGTSISLFTISSSLAVPEYLCIKIQSVLLYITFLYCFLKSQVYINFRKLCDYVGYVVYEFHFGMFQIFLIKS